MNGQTTEGGIAREWRDVSELCASVADGMQIGEMLHVQHFDLFEAMSALELMEPKMDRDLKAQHSITDLLKSGALPTTDAAFGDESVLCDVLDGIVTCEVAWHDGGSMPETLYTCLYLHPAAYGQLLKELQQGPAVRSALEKVLKVEMDSTAAAAAITVPEGCELMLLLTAYVLATLRCCCIARDVVLLADIYEEEDFTSNSFGFKLMPAASDAFIVALLQRAVLVLAQRTAEQSSIGDGDSTAVAVYERLQAHMTCKQEQLKGLLTLKAAFSPEATFVQRQLNATNGIVPVNSDSSAAAAAIAAAAAAAHTADSEAVSSSAADEQKQSTTAAAVAVPLQNGDHDADQLLVGCTDAAVAAAAAAAAAAAQRRSVKAPHEGVMAALVHLEKAHAAAVYLEECTKRCKTVTATAAAEAAATGSTTAAATTDTAASSIAAAAAVIAGHGTSAFDREFNRALLGSTPHRYVPLYSLPKALQQLRELLRDMVTACSVMKCDTLSDVRHHLMCFAAFAEWSTAVQQQGSYAGPCIAPRSIAAVCLYRGDLLLGKHNSDDFVTAALVHSGVPVSLLQNDVGAQLIERALKPLYEQLRALCLNRARLRAKLEVCMADWSVIQEEAAGTDDCVRLAYCLPETTPHYASNWSMREALYLMELHIRTGAQLELYSGRELCAVYFYWDYLLSAIVHIDNVLLEGKQQLRALQQQLDAETAAAAAQQQQQQLVSSAVEAAADGAATAHNGDSTDTAAAAAAAKPKKKAKKKKKKSTSTELTVTTTAAAAAAGTVRSVDGAAAQTDESNEQQPFARDPAHMLEMMQAQVNADYYRLCSFLVRGALRYICAVRKLQTAADAIASSSSSTGTAATHSSDSSINNSSSSSSSTSSGSSADSSAAAAPQVSATAASTMFEHRFAAFAAIAVPSVLSYADFEESTHFSDMTGADLLSSAGECFSAARAALTRLKQVLLVSTNMAAECNGKPVKAPVSQDEMKALARVAVANSVAVAAAGKQQFTAGSSSNSSAQQGKAVAAAAEVTYDFGTHPEFPILGIAAGR
jgi:Arc/MetJ-type ribon-helix-helix transcriptional regulator